MLIKKQEKKYIENMGIKFLKYGVYYGKDNSN